MGIIRCRQPSSASCSFPCSFFHSVPSIGLHPCRSLTGSLHLTVLEYFVRAIFFPSLPQPYPPSAADRRIEPSTSSVPMKPAEEETVFPPFLVDIPRHVYIPSPPCPFPARFGDLCIGNVYQRPLKELIGPGWGFFGQESLGRRRGDRFGDAGLNCGCDRQEVAVCSWIFTKDERTLKTGIANWSSSNSRRSLCEEVKVGLPPVEEPDARIRGTGTISNTIDS
jgi:hypothetical protein